MSQVPHNPYASPLGQPKSTPPPNQSTGKIMAPGIALTAVAGIGILATIFSIVQALFIPVAPPDPTMPEWVIEMQANSRGVFAAVVQVAFGLLNCLILFGGIQMIRTKSWGLCLTASILAMVNLGSCCCVIGLPVGIWSVVILSRGDVKQMFDAAR